MKTKQKHTVLLTGVIAVLILALCLFLLQELLRPKYGQLNIPEGTLIADYYDDPTAHDVIFIGDCEVYENFSPVTLWEEQGITSFIRGSAQQLIWQSYYLLEDTLRYETPEVVVFNVLSMKYGEPQSEAYNRLNLDGMRWSASKVGAVRASMTEQEDFLSYVFPLLRYHSRWSELSVKDVTGMFRRESVSHAGFLMRADVKPAGTVPEGRPLAEYRFDQSCYDYLDKMADLCEENGIRLVLIKAPSLYPYWYDEWDEQMEDYARERGISYINFLDKIDEVGLDFTQDTYDGGLHLNLSGAEKLSRWFGRWLAENCGLPDHGEDAEINELWAGRSQRYHAMAADQARELAELGYLKSYGAKKPE
ncbi:MAG: SGNH/GDSL hydrolase family protein [Oscillibacter sp.]|nr:SGNH/GDSL hydrolase family protein [Oscillibacter sp.]